MISLRNLSDQGLFMWQCSIGVTPRAFGKDHPMAHLPRTSSSGFGTDDSSPAVPLPETGQDKPAPFGNSRLPNGDLAKGDLAQKGPDVTRIAPHPQGGAELPLEDSVLGADPDRDPDLESSDDDTAQTPENGQMPRN
jgi:hypothetical protein